MTKRLCLVKWRGMPMSGTTLRKGAKCKDCGRVIAKGSHAYRPLLEKEINGVLRMDRICPGCAKSQGTDKLYA